MKGDSTNQNQRLHESVLLRDDFTCQTCGATDTDVGVREHMRVGFIARNDPAVKNSTLDLKTLCPDCDDGFETAKLLPRMGAPELIAELRRATVADQLAMRDVLRRKR
jgi:5-methylcytosine-specific restriction endonuclease McrA